MVNNHDNQNKRVADCSATHPNLKQTPVDLESELHPKLARESVRNDHAARSNEGVRFSEGCLPHVACEIVSEIRPVRQIKHLEEHSHRRPLVNSEILVDAKVELEVRLSSQIVEREYRALASADAIAILASDSITVTRVTMLSIWRRVIVSNTECVQRGR